MPEHHAAASLPPSGYQRPSRRTQRGLAVSVVGEDGTDFGVYDFTKVAAPSGVVLPLVDAFEVATGSAGRWRSKASADTGASNLRRFAEKLVELQPDIETIAQLRPETWWAWVQFISERNRWPGQINSVRALLRDTEGVPEVTRRALNRRAQKPKTRTYNAYSRSEYRRIRATAWRITHRAARRITANMQMLDAYQSGCEQQDAPSIRVDGGWMPLGALLAEISLTGVVGRKSRPVDREVFDGMLAIPDGGHLAHALYPTSSEVAWLMVVFACELGYNHSVIASLTVDAARADDGQDDSAVYSHDLDKPRRGPSKRYFSSSFVGDAAKLFQTAVAITQPARDTLDRLGDRTNALLISRTAGGGGGLFKTDWSTSVSTILNGTHKMVGEDGEPLNVTVQRLRLTDEVVNQRSAQNSEAVSETVYRQPDPQTRQQAAEVIVRGQQDALTHAAESVQMRAVGWQSMSAVTAEGLAVEAGVSRQTADALLRGKLDTATGACLDFTNSPFAEAPGKPCPASFFACFACSNAVATPAHLPRLVALHDALKRTASVVDDAVWNNDWAPHFQRLDDLLSTNATATEVAEARERITEADLETIDHLLHGRWDP